MDAVFMRAPVGGKNESKPVRGVGGAESIFCKLSLRGGVVEGKRRVWK